MPDTDGDVINDDEEDSCKTFPGVRENNRCPNIKKEAVRQIELAVTKIFFKNGISLIPSSYAALNKVAEVLKANQYMRLSIEGHTDNVGTAEYNQLLSENSANAVADYLANKGVEEHRLLSVGYGFSKLVADIAGEEGRRKNRRV